METNQAKSNDEYIHYYSSNKNVYSEPYDMQVLYETCYLTYPNTWISMKNIRQIAIEQKLFRMINLSEHSGKIRFSIKIRQMIGRVIKNIGLTNIGGETRPAYDKYLFIHKDDNYKKAKIN